MTDEFEFSLISYIILEFYVSIGLESEYFCNLVALDCSRKDDFAIPIHCLFIQFEYQIALNETDGINKYCWVLLKKLAFGHKLCLFNSVNQSWWENKAIWRCLGQWQLRAIEVAFKALKISQLFCFQIRLNGLAKFFRQWEKMSVVLSEGN